MKFMANAILVVLIMTIFIMVFSNFILFFPWYLTLMYQTYNLSVQAASENYVSTSMVADVKNDLVTRPIFSSMGADDIGVFMDEIKIDSFDPDYLQRGERFTVGLECSFPFEIKFGDASLEREVSVKFEIPTTGLRYYKDLE